MRFKEIKIVEAPDLMTQYNRGGKKALPAIKDLQTKLKAAGFDPNGIDGKYGPGTFKAVQAYQKANGLQADGQAGDSTLAKINAGGAAPQPQAQAPATQKAAPAKADTTAKAPAPGQPANAAPTGGTQAKAASTTPQTTQPANTQPADAKPATDPEPTANTTATTPATDAEPTANTTATTGDQSPTKAQDGGDASTYTLDGKPVSRAEYEKRFGTDVSGRQNDVANLKSRIQGSSRAAEDEKSKWVQAQLDDPNSKYYDGVPDDPDDPSYPAELKAIDDKYAKQNAADQQKIKDLSSDPRVANNVKSDFDKALDGDDDAFGKAI